jgi:hypothetical protein
MFYVIVLLLYKQINAPLIFIRYGPLFSRKSKFHYMVLLINALHFRVLIRVTQLSEIIKPFSRTTPEIAACPQLMKFEGKTFIFYSKKKKKKKK